MHEHAYSYLCITFSELSPAFLTPLKDQIVDEFQTAEFMCEVNKDGATPKWSLDGLEINEDERYLLISEGRTHKLVIKEAILPDSGEITAKVEDKKTSANLTVKGRVENLIFDVFPKF